MTSILKRSVNVLRVRFHEFFKYKELFNLLVIKDIKLKYRRSYFGYAWSILSPLGLMLVMTVVFSKMFNDSIQNYPAYLFGGNILFSFFNWSVGRTRYSLLNNSSLLKKVFIPKYMFVLSDITSELVNLGFSLCALVIVMVITHVEFSFFFFLLVIPVAELYIFCVGVGLFMAQAVLFFRDLGYIWSVLVTVWMYLTPIFYPVDKLPNVLQWLVIHFNPLYLYITTFRDVTIYHTMGAAYNIYAGFIIAFAALFIGAFFFIKNKDKFILYI